MLARFCKNGATKLQARRCCISTAAAAKVDGMLEEMYSDEFDPKSEAYAAILQACARARALPQGKLVHSHIVANGLEPLMFLGNHLINMYVKCGSTQDALAMFEKMSDRNVVTWTTIIAASTQNGQRRQAFAYFSRMQQEGILPNTFTFVAILNACTEELAHGLKVHELAAEVGIENDLYVGNAIVAMYGRFGKMEEAKDVFEQMPIKDVVSWTSFVGGYAQARHCREAVEAFERLLQEGVIPNKVTFITALSACSSWDALADGRRIHSCISECGFEDDLVVANALMNMYSKCRSFEGCEQVFSGMDEQDVISWNAMITASAERNGGKALLVFRTMQLEGVRPNSITFISFLGAFTDDENSGGGGLGIRELLLESGYYATDTGVCNALLNMYAKCGSFLDARSVFLSMNTRDLISWNAMLNAVYGEHGTCQDVMKVFEVMQLEGMTPNKVTLVTLLNAASDLEVGRRIHSLASQADEDDLVLGTALVSMYGRCGSVEDAEAVFQRMPLKNLVSWNAMLGAYSQQQNGGAAACEQLFHMMLVEGEVPDSLTFTMLLSAMLPTRFAEVSEMLRACILESGCYPSLCMDTALVNSYSKCGSFEQAKSVFEDGLARQGNDVILWTSMIAACGHRNSAEVRSLFRRMQLEGVKPDGFTFTTVLEACVNCSFLDLGRMLHSCILESIADVAVENALVNMYSRCGSLQDSRAVFDTMKERDLVSWNAMLVAYASHQQGSAAAGEALKLFRTMLLEAAVEPDKVTFATALNACAAVAVLATGRMVHSLVVECELQQEPSVATGLVKMFAKCGKLEEARRVFELRGEWSLPLVNAMIAALAQHGHSHEAVKLFRRMEQEGSRPDNVTLLSVISACSHAGLVEDGCNSFFSMTEYHGVKPTLDHYACLVDLLGRAGKLELAEELANKVPEETIVWMSLLGACKLQGDIERGKRAAEKIIQLEPENVPARVLLSNIYSAAGRLEDAADLKKDARRKLVKKEAAGTSSIEIGGRVHEFVASDTSHSHTGEIYQELERLSSSMRAASELMPQDTDDDLQEHMLCYHSEMLTIAYGMLVTAPGTRLTVMKNLRVCAECHTAAKYMSKISERDIIVRDAFRFHHFRPNGTCSCKDYW